MRKLNMNKIAKSIKDEVLDEALKQERSKATQSSARIATHRLMFSSATSLSSSLAFISSSIISPFRHLPPDCPDSGFSGLIHFNLWSTKCKGDGDSLHLCM